MSKYGFFSGLYFPVLGLSPIMGKYEPEKNPAFGHFPHSVEISISNTKRFFSLYFTIFLTRDVFRTQSNICDESFLRIYFFKEDPYTSEWLTTILAM